MKGILESAKAIHDQIVKDRRYIHQHPELGFDLSNTSAYVKERLAEMGIEAQECGGPLDPELRKAFLFAGFPDMEKSTGLVATIGKGGKTFLLRADMDALPIHETTGEDYAFEGNVGHMCGHDSHTAMLLGAAKILKEHEDELQGTVKLMFQTGEECGCGSRLMVENGLLENPKVDAACALHVMPIKEFGTIGYTRGIISAGMDTFMIKIQGKGGHSSTPQNAIDPLMIMNQLYSTLNLFVGREIDPKETVALTIGKAGGGAAANVIPDTAELQVGARTFNLDVSKHITTRVPELVDHIVKAWRGEYEMMTFNTPSTYNDADLCDELVPFVEEIVGAENVAEDPTPLSGTEDFGYVSKEVPGMFMWLGAGKPGNYPLHNPNMVLDEDVFPLGSAILANCAIEWLAKNK